MTVAIVTGSIAPYTNRLYDAYAARYGEDVHVFQCAAVEPLRQWTLPVPKHYRLVTLSGFRHHRTELSHIYLNPGIWRELSSLAPDAVIIQSFSPTMLLAALFARRHGTALGIGIEGDLETDPGLHSFLHGSARRLVTPRCDFGTCSSFRTREMMEYWGLKPGTGFMVPHCGTWDAPTDILGHAERPYDLLFCGSLSERKNPMFFAEVAERLTTRGLRPRLRVVGDGPLRESFLQRLSATGCEVQFDGYLQQDRIVDAYRTSKVFLFPTHADVWGLVANEALLCATPIIASPHAIASHELVAAYHAGTVLPLDATAWSDEAERMLTSPEHWTSFHRNRAQAIDWFSLSTAVTGFAQAVEAGRAARRERTKPTESATSIIDKQPRSGNIR